MPEYLSPLRSLAPVTVFLVLCAILPLDHVGTYTQAACSDNPCMNGGQCVDMGTQENPKQFTCACVEGYTGITCQKRIDLCADEPCQNGGICEPRGEHFHCSCSDRFKGRLCEQYIRKRNPCLGDPCGSHGYCEVVNYDFLCECSPGYHGERCEFSEDDDDDNDKEVLVAAVEESESAQALLIGRVVLGMLIVFGVILILLAIHWMRVANKRSKHAAAQEIRIANGQQPENTPGWFETSNELCYDFFCYCCKLVNKWENEGKIIINCDDPNAKECFEKCCGQGPPTAVKVCRNKMLGSGANSPKMPASGAPSLGFYSPKSGSKVPSQAGSTIYTRPASRSPGRQGSSYLGDEGDEQANASTNQLGLVDDECWACLPRDRSQNRAGTGPEANPAPASRYGAARNYPVIPSKYGEPQQNRYGTEIKMVDDRRSGPRDVGKRTARGALPGFQPCSDYLLGETVGDVDRQDIPQRVPSNVIRVRRRTPPRGKSNRAVVDIMDCGPKVNDDDEDFDDDEDDDEEMMVGPKGNVLAMSFHKGAVGMHKSEDGHVDPMYFEDGHCSNQSNSFGGYNYDEPYRGAGEPNPSSRQRQRRVLRGRSSMHRNNHADYSGSDDTENDSTDMDEDKEQKEEALESDDVGETDDDGNDGDGNGELFIPSPRRHSSRRRPRRFFLRRSRVSQRDDGYSSTGRVSESDAGGRSRDPITMEAATKQAQRNFYSRQPRQPFDAYATPPPPPYPPQPQGRVLRKDLPDVTTSRRAPQGGPGVTLSPHSAAPGTPPVVYSNCPSPAQHRFEPLKSSSPYTDAGAESHTDTPQQYYQPLQQQKQQPPNFPRGALQGYSNRQLHNNVSQVFEENYPRGGTPNSRRPRHSLRGWDRSSGTYAYASEHSSYETATPTLEQQMPPVRRQKVKGILKKTSAYGSSTPAGESGRNHNDARTRPSSTEGFNYTPFPKRPGRYPLPHVPRAYDQFVV